MKDTPKDADVIVVGVEGTGMVAAITAADEGAKVAVNYVADKEGVNQSDANKVTKEIKNLKTDAITVQANVSDIDQVNKMVNEVMAKFGKIEI